MGQKFSQFKDPVAHMCLAADAVVAASWSLTQEVVGPSDFNDKYFCNEFAEFSKTFRQNVPVVRS